MKKTVFTLTLLLSAALITAHEFWLQPGQFIYQWGDIINIKLLVGENFEGENWTGNRNSIQQLHLHLSDATDDMSPYIDTTKGDSLQFALYDEGTYMLSYHSTNKPITLEPAKFLEYLKEDGLQNAIDYRAQHGETDSIGREYYQRSVKTLFQVGNKTTMAWKKPTGLPLDIQPLQNPYELRTGDAPKEISFRILFQQQPLPNQLIKIWHRVNGQTTKKEVLTDADGRIRFPLATTGYWMVSTVKMDRIEGNPEAQWQSYWGSCTFGYQ